MKSLQKVFEYRKQTSQNLVTNSDKVKKILESFINSISVFKNGSSIIKSNYDRDKGVLIITTLNKTLSNEILLRRGEIEKKFKDQNLILAKIIIR